MMLQMFEFWEVMLSLFEPDDESILGSIVSKLERTKIGWLSQFDRASDLCLKVFEHLVI